MSLTLRKKVFITPALTGSGGTQNKSLNVPRSPQQISKAAIAAAKAGAAVVHCHVRDPKTGEPARELALYREVTELIRAADVAPCRYEGRLHNSLQTTAERKYCCPCCRPCSSASASWGWPFYWGKVEGKLPMPLCSKLADDRWRAIRIYILSLAKKLMSRRKSVGQGRGQLTLTQ